jgi:hypothetical protein
METLKGALKSKTVWFGMTVAALSWLQQFVGTLEGLSPEQVSLIGTGIGSIVIWLRLVSNVSLTQKGKE